MKNFVEKCIVKHNNKYDYSKSKYIDTETKITITCKVHGDFEQLPHNHLKGHGCPKCYYDNNRNKNIIERFTNMHNDKYDYSMVEYIDLRTPVKIICKEHGVFKQMPQTHLIGCGCQKCSGNNKLNKEKFEHLSNLKHNNKYDYSNSIIKNSKTKVIITCPYHGDFEQVPTSHYLKGYGCPKCKRSKGEEIVEKYLIENNISFIYQKKFDECKNIKTLPFDFYLPDYDCCIEYDGPQHFIMDGYINKNQDELDLRIKCDEIKNEYCKNNNIRLIRIKYDESIIDKINIF